MIDSDHAACFSDIVACDVVFDAVPCCTVASGEKVDAGHEIAPNDDG